MNEGIQLIMSRRFDSMEALFTMIVFGVNTVEKQHVVVYIQVQRGTKSLDQCD